MSERKISFNPQAGKRTPEPTSKPFAKQKEKKKGRKPKKERSAESTRSIRFEKRRVSFYITIMFWFVFLVSLGVNFISFARFNYLVDLANDNRNNEEQVAEASDSAVYEAQFYAKEFIRTLFTFDETNKEGREETLQNQLASNLSLSNISRLNSDVKQSVQRVELIDSKTIVKDKKQYYCYTYQVTFTLNDEAKTTQLMIETSYENKDFKVTNVPTYLNLKPSLNAEANAAFYDETSHYTKGEKVEDLEREKLETFTKEFFNLYVTNDESLKLISNVTGLNAQALLGVQIRNVVQKNDKYIVEGSYTFSYAENSELTSFFSAVVTKMADSYFVTSLDN